MVVNWWKFVISCCCSYSKLLKTTSGLLAKLGKGQFQKECLYPSFPVLVLNNLVVVMHKRTSVFKLGFLITGVFISFILLY